MSLLAGRRHTITRGNGSVTTYAYDGISRLTSLDQNLGAPADNQTLGFSYTAASQIASRSASNDNYHWSAPTLNAAYVRNGLNQYTSVGGTSYAYDLRGNLTSDGARSFSYDLENHLLSVTGAMSLAYDPLGRLRQTTAGAATTDFLYDGDRLIAEYSGAALTERYVHGAGVDEPLVWYHGNGTSDRRYLIADNQGSIIAENDASTTRYTYGPYGEPNAWVGTGGAQLSRFRYTGQIALPEAQLDHYKARVYDPVIGRFLQTDPVGYTADLDLYAYVENDPLNRADSTGEFPDPDTGAMDRRDLDHQLAAAGDAVATAIAQHPAETAEVAGNAISMIPTPPTQVGGRVLAGAGVFARLVAGARRFFGRHTFPDRVFANAKTPRQTTPGTRTETRTRYNERTGEGERSTARYDRYGRQTGRTDYTNHGRSVEHTDPHHHTTTYRPNRGGEVESGPQPGELPPEP